MSLTARIRLLSVLAITIVVVASVSYKDHPDVAPQKADGYLLLRLHGGERPRSSVPLLSIPAGSDVIGESPTPMPTLRIPVIQAAPSRPGRPAFQPTDTDTMPVFELPSVNDDELGDSRNGNTIR